MKQLVVIYDDSCAFCVRCRWWLAWQPAYVEYMFVPRSSPALARLFPTLSQGHKTELIVVGEDGSVYRDDAAFIMCLYGLHAYREWALRLATPALMPFAAQFFRTVSKRRRWLSRVFGGASERQLERMVEHQPTHVCDTCI